jgi:hypothetical protein
MEENYITFYKVWDKKDKKYKGGTNNYWNIYHSESGCKSFITKEIKYNNRYRGEELSKNDFEIHEFVAQKMKTIEVK